MTLDARACWYSLIPESMALYLGQEIVDGVTFLSKRAAIVADREYEVEEKEWLNPGCTGPEV